MDLFPIGGFVRLRSRGRGDYVHADEDGVYVSLRPLGTIASVNAVWKVDLLPVQGGDDRRLLLQGAAYGRYLASADEDEVPPLGHHGVRAVQRNYDCLALAAPFRWAPYMAETGQNYVRLYNDDQRCLRANGRRSKARNLVTVDDSGGSNTPMMQWRVEAIPSTPVPLPLPPPPPPTHGRRGLFSSRSRNQPAKRTVWFCRLRDDGNPVSDDCPESVSFQGNSVSKLTQLARLKHGRKNITLGVRAGQNARVLPLVADLPSTTDPIQVIIYAMGSPAAAQLRYPQFEKPEA